MDSYPELTTSAANFQQHFDDACERLRNRAQQQELQRNEIETKLAKLKECELEATRIRDLETENATLSEEVQNLRSDPRLADDFIWDSNINAHEETLLSGRKKREPSCVIQDYGDSPPDRVDYEVYSRLVTYYRELYAENTHLFTSFFAVRRKLKASMERIKEWNRLFSRQSFDVIVNGKKLFFKRTNRDSLIAANEERKSTTPEPPSLPPMIPGNPRSIGKSYERANSPQRQLHDSDPASTQSQDPRYAVEQSFPPLEISSSDTPAVITERPVGRRGAERYPAPDPVNNDKSLGTGNATQPITIKAEPLSSSPDPEHATPVAHWAPSNKPQESNMVSRPTFTGDNLPSPAFPVFTDEDHAAVPSKSDVRKDSVDRIAQANEKKRSRPALQAVDCNITPTRRSYMNTPEPKSKRRKPESRGAEGVPCVAEDGEAEDYKLRRRASRLNNTTTDENVSPMPGLRQKRLQDLLEIGQGHTPKPVLKSSPKLSNTPTPNRNVTKPRPTNRDHTQPRMPAMKHTPVPKSRPARHWPPQLGLSHDENDDDDEIRPEEEPYRVRPVNCLSLEHFRLNPKRNQGLDYAFKEVVRDKGLRKQLRGCLREECCGPVFRSMAKDEIGDKPYSLNTLTQQHLELLDEEVGGNSKRALEKASGREIRDLLIIAKARVFSNQFSRHRHSNTHGRARTPPGYWRTDMPSTQEEQLDHELATTLERQKVLERYNEAVKDSGFWKFADE